MRRRECRLYSGHQSFVTICGNNRRPDPFLKQAPQVRNSPKVIKLALLIHEADSNCETLSQPFNSQALAWLVLEVQSRMMMSGFSFKYPTDLFIIRLFSGSIIGSPTYRISAMNIFSMLPSSEIAYSKNITPFSFCSVNFSIKASFRPLSLHFQQISPISRRDCRYPW
jgi:hypothetical protein